VVGEREAAAPDTKVHGNILQSPSLFTVFDGVFDESMRHRHFRVSPFDTGMLLVHAELVTA